MISKGSLRAHVCLTATTTALFAGAAGSSASASQTHILKHGQTIEFLGHHYHVAVKDILAANHLSATDILSDGRSLYIPDAPRPVVVPQSMRRSARIKGDRISVRIGPASSQHRLRLCDNGAPLVVTAEQNGWLQVELADGRSGWVRSDFVHYPGTGHAGDPTGDVPATPVSPGGPGLPPAVAAGRDRLRTLVATTGRAERITRKHHEERGPRHEAAANVRERSTESAAAARSRHLELAAQARHERHIAAAAAGRRHHASLAAAHRHAVEVAAARRHHERVAELRHHRHLQELVESRRRARRLEASRSHNHHHGQAIAESRHKHHSEELAHARHERRVEELAAARHRHHLEALANVHRHHVAAIANHNRRARLAAARHHDGTQYAHNIRPEAGSPTPSNDVVRSAFAYRGTPYRWGESRPGGFDCSGFTKYIYGRKGVSLPRTAAEQYHAGRPVGHHGMKPGDLVFFHTTRSGISHVGMYVGNGKFVHSSSKRNGGVRVDSLASGYYSKAFRGARRVRKDSNEPSGE